MLERDNINVQPNAEQAKAYAMSENNDPHLRSWEKVKGVVVNGSDGEIGHIQHLLIGFDNEDWISMGGEVEE